jgi:hypothetical protein
VSEGPDQHTARLLAVVNLLAEMALQTLQQGEEDGARSFVDCIESLREKTKGNVGPEEEQIFETVLHQLRLAVLKGPPPKEEGKGSDGEDVEAAAGPGGDQDAEPAKGKPGADAEPAG